MCHKMSNRSGLKKKLDLLIKKWEIFVIVKYCNHLRHKIQTFTPLKLCVAIAPLNFRRVEIAHICLQIQLFKHLVYS